MSTRGWEHVTPSDVAAKQARMPHKASKYRNVKTVIHGETFDSKREAAHWLGLLAREQAGEIRNLRRQVALPLYCPDRKISEPWTWLQVSSYVADFWFEESHLGEVWNEVVADAKGKRTQMYLLKRKWLELQEGILIREL